VQADEARLVFLSIRKQQESISDAQYHEIPNATPASHKTAHAHSHIRSIKRCMIATDLPDALCYNQVLSFCSSLSDKHVAITTATTLLSHYQ